MSIDLSVFEDLLREHYPFISPERLTRIQWNAFCAIWTLVGSQAHDDRKAGITRPRYIIDMGGWGDE